MWVGSLKVGKDMTWRPWAVSHALQFLCVGLARKTYTAEDLGPTQPLGTKGCTEANLT